MTVSITYTIVGHMFIPSSCNWRLIAAPPAGLAATPSTKVGNQSLTCMRPFWTVPLTLGGNRGLLTKPTAFNPPSNTDPFLPRNGQLLPLPDSLPPLSLKIITARR